MTELFAEDSRSNRERMLAGDPYIADAELAQLSQQALSRTYEYERAYLEDPASARRILENLIGELGTGVDIRPPLRVDYGSNISIGEGTFINFNLTALDVAPIKIGADCQIGPNVQLLTPTHPLDPEERRSKIESAQPIILGDNVWLGGGVVILPGVSIGHNSVIGAGAVVTRDIPAGVVAAGNPARVIKQLA